MAVRSIRVILSSDITQFTENLRNAKRSVASLGSELNHEMQRIRANQSLAMATLGNYATPLQQLNTKLKYAQQSLPFLEAHFQETTTRLNQMRTEVAGTNIDLKGFELAQSKAATEVQKMTNRVEALKRAISQLRPDAIRATMDFQTKMAGLNSQMGVAKLGNNPSQIATLRAAMAGLNEEMVVNARVQMNLTQDMVRLAAAEGTTIEQTRKLKLEMAQAKLAGQNMSNQMKALKNSIASIRPDTTMARLAHNTEMASIATRRYVADLGYGATQERINQATVRGLNGELEANARLQRTLTAEINRLSTATGNNSTRLRQTQRDLANAGLAAQEMRNRIVQLSRTTLEPIRASAEDLMQTGFALSAMITAPTMAMARAGIMYNSMFESNLVSFKTMIGNGDQALKLMQKLQEMAVFTPFETQDLTKQGTTLLQYGMNVKNVVPMLKLLGDVSLGQKEKFQVIAYNFAQAMSLGRLTAIDARSMTLAGFNPLANIGELRKKRGEYAGLSQGDIYDKLQKEMEATGIPIKDLVDAMKMATSEGGRFFNAMANAAKTFDGQMSTLRDNIKMTFAEITAPLFDVLAKDILPVLNKALIYIRAFAKENPKITQGLVIELALLASIGPALLGAYAVFKSWTGLQLILDGIIRRTIALRVAAVASLTSMRVAAVNAYRAMMVASAISMRAVITHLASVALAVGKLILRYTALAASVLVIAGATYVMVKNWDEAKTAMSAAGTEIKNMFAVLWAGIKVGWYGVMKALGESFDWIKAKSKDLFSGNFKFDSPIESSQFTKRMGVELGVAKYELETSKDELVKSAGEYLQAWEKLKNAGIKSLAELKPEMPDWGSAVGEFKTEEVDTKDLLDSVKSGSEETQKEMDKWIDAIVNAAKKFRDALGLFDKVAVEKFSGTQLLVRVKQQMKLMTTWASDLSVLKNAWGQGSTIFQDILDKGVSAAGQVRALARLSAVDLEAYRQAFEGKSAVALQMAGIQVAEDKKQEKKIEQISININGGLVLGNIDQLVAMVTEQLKRQGVV